MGFCSFYKHSRNMPGDGLLLDRVEELPANVSEKVLIKLWSVFYIKETLGLN